jgi:hypothetical protein
MVSCNQYVNQEAGPSRETNWLCPPHSLPHNSTMSQGLGQVNTWSVPTPKTFGFLEDENGDGSQNIGSCALQPPDIATCPRKFYGIALPSFQTGLCYTGFSQIYNCLYTIHQKCLYEVMLFLNTKYFKANSWKHTYWSILPIFCAVE